MLSRFRRYFSTLSKRRPYRRPERRGLVLELLEDRTTPSSLALLSTDQSDYAPGSTCIFQGTGFEVGESIDIEGATRDVIKAVAIAWKQ